MEHQNLVFNGIDGARGAYLLNPLSSQVLAQSLQQEQFDEVHVRDLRHYNSMNSAITLGMQVDFDRDNLAEVGWGVIFAPGTPSAVREALKDLLDLRRAQASRSNEQYYHEFDGGDSYQLGDTYHTFLRRYGMLGRQIDPARIPYYLLLVGDLDAIPSSFQQQLGLHCAVGRLAFSTPEEYAWYARSIVEAERRNVTLPRQAAFFSVQNPDDQATALSTTRLVYPLYDRLRTQPSLESTWSMRLHPHQEATRTQLLRLLGGDQTPALLFIASHGMAFPNDDVHQFMHQGALLCQDWPGPGSGVVPRDCYLSAEDIVSDARIWGSVFIYYAAFAVGTAAADTGYARLLHTQAGVTLRPGISQLPQSLLSHPHGGALAIVGPMSQVSPSVFEGPQPHYVLQSCHQFIKKLLEGDRVGMAFEAFVQLCATVTMKLHDTLEDMMFGMPMQDRMLVDMWIARNDVSSFAILGDPAVRLNLSHEMDSAVRRPVL